MSTLDENDPLNIARRASEAASAKEGVKLGDVNSGGINGDANVITGGIHSDVTDNRHQVFNIETKELSEAERLRKNKTEYRCACAEEYKDGYISEDGARRINALRLQLGISKDTAEDIQREVKEQSIQRRTTLPQAGKILLSQVKFAIESNNQTDIRSRYAELAAARTQMDVPELNQMYFQLKALLHFGDFIRDLQVPHEESYWEVFWSYVAYIFEGSSKAEAALMRLSRWDNIFPPQNQALLKTVGDLMRNRIKDARVAYSNIRPGFSKDLEPLYNTLHDLLDQYWEGAEVDVSAASRFYVDALFPVVYREFKDLSKKAVAAEIEAKAAAEAEARELKDKKERFLNEYEKRNGNVGDALLMSGATQTMLSEWERYDADFVMAKKTVDKRLADKVAAEAERQRQLEEQRQREEAERLRIAELKNEFKRQFEANDCDLLKTCKDTGISSATFQKWKSSDRAFSDSIDYLQREHNVLIDRQRRDIRKKRFRIALPFILIAVLVGLIFAFLSFKGCCDSNNHRKEYNNKVLECKNALEKIDSVEVLFLEQAFEILLEIKKTKDDMPLKDRAKYYELQKDFFVKSNNMKLYYNGLLSGTSNLEEKSKQQVRDSLKAIQGRIEKCENRLK